jgi:hypothetical protein
MLAPFWPIHLSERRAQSWGFETTAPTRRQLTAATIQDTAILDTAVAWQQAYARYCYATTSVVFFACAAKCIPFVCCSMLQYDTLWHIGNTRDAREWYAKTQNKNKNKIHFEHDIHQSRRRRDSMRVIQSTCAAPETSWSTDNAAREAISWGRLNLVLKTAAGSRKVQVCTFSKFQM